MKQLSHLYSALIEDLLKFSFARGLHCYYGCQHIIEIMGNASGKLPYGLQLLHMQKLCLHFPLFFLPLLTSADIFNNRDKILGGAVRLMRKGDSEINPHN